MLLVDSWESLTAANASLSYQLAMADAIIYATALTHKAKLVTSDADLGSLPDVVYLRK
jgi:predicted nucleic acid-binding protein